MRLICPNCGAQYEVPDGVVPHEGRDVQCSNCGNTWFQAHPDNDQALTYELDPPQVEEPDNSEWSDQTDDPTEIETDDLQSDADRSDYTADDSADDLPPDHSETRENDWDTPDSDEEEWQGFDDDTPTETDGDLGDASTDEAAAEPDHVPQNDDHSAETDDDYGDDADNDSAQQPTVAQKELDPSVADILQQEAAHEAQARATESTLESQPDLGLDEAAADVDQRTREANERMARLRGDTPLEESVAATVAASSRRDLLPDIDEINSTLRSTSDRKSGLTEELYDEDFETPRKSGRFRRGFWMIILAALVLFLIYIFSPQIIKALPVLEGVMNSYVALVDQLRVWLDGRVQSTLQWLDTKASSSGN